MNPCEHSVNNSRVWVHKLEFPGTGTWNVRQLCHLVALPVITSNILRVNRWEKERVRSFKFWFGHRVWVTHPPAQPCLQEQLLRTGTPTKTSLCLKRLLRPPSATKMLCRVPWKSSHPKHAQRAQLPWQQTMTPNIPRRARDSTWALPQQHKCAGASWTHHDGLE